MCGIAGLLEQGRLADDLRQTAASMAAALVHRGPDASGAWADDAHGIALAHTRLSILELSPAGHQPMASACGRYVIIFNGEIYNHLSLRDELAASAASKQTREIAWRGRSDTETLLAALAAWGLEATLEHLVGMFAFALWDRHERVLTLARDRIGEKPLYYGLQGGALLFASELKALRAHPRFRAEIDRGAVALYLRHACVPAPYSIYTDVRKLPPGTYLQIRPTPDRGAVSPGSPVAYWSPRDVARAGASNPFDGSEEEAEAELSRLLMRSTAGQMVADVPLGAFLSGGVDSSTVVALMQAQAAGRVKTFTIGFREKGYDEAAHARTVAAHLGTDHTELYVTAEQAMAAIPRLPMLYDEPFGDPSQIPTHLVSQLARRHVSVSLSGDGGDELFGGYNRHVWASRIWKRVAWLPAGVRSAVASALTRVPPASWDAALDRFGRLLPSNWRYADAGSKLHKLSELLGGRTPEEIYLRLVSVWNDPGAIVKDASEPLIAHGDSARWPELPNLTDRMMYLDLVGYLPDDILVKIDRAAMGVSLETRVPMLDHRLIEFAWRLPLSLKIRGSTGKWILRQLLYRHVPRQLIERPKAGFALPLDEWLRGPLRSWADSLLNARRIDEQGLLASAAVRGKWNEHLSGRRNWAPQLWAVLMLQAWMAHVHPSTSTA